ncbi:MAG TPA: hypothetical protein DCY07_08440 [Rhodospirillaceae bacterium]|nr:hypothetical protein [Rhodospirillaceae bacterium]
MNNVSLEEAKEVQKVLGTPVFIAFSEEMIKMRRNLVMLAFGTWAYKELCFPTNEISFVGIKLGFRSLDSVERVLFYILLYSLIHFLWNSTDALFEWRNRITGSRISFVTTGKSASRHGDYPDDPRQSSLLTWWRESAPRIRNMKAACEKLEGIAEDLKNRASEKEFGGMPNINHITMAAGDITNRAAELERQIAATSEILLSSRIPASLERFEAWFRLFSWSQLARFFLLEWGFPILLSVWALLLVSPWKVE